MGQVIHISDLFLKRKQLQKADHLAGIFIKYFRPQVVDQQILRSFIDNLLAEQALPAIELDASRLLYLEYQLGRYILSGPVVYFRALNFARLHLEKTLNLKVYKLKSVMRYLATSSDKGERSAFIILGMFSLAWQIMLDEELVIDEKSFAKRHSQTQTPDV